jgi:hypothetical protein
MHFTSVDGDIATTFQRTRKGCPYQNNMPQTRFATPTNGDVRYDDDEGAQVQRRQGPLATTSEAVRDQEHGRVVHDGWLAWCVYHRAHTIGPP